MVRFVCVNSIDCKQQTKYILWLIIYITRIKNAKVVWYVYVLFR